MAEYVSQKGWKASAAPTGVPGVSAAWRPSVQPDRNRPVPARTATMPSAATRTPVRRGSASGCGGRRGLARRDLVRGRRRRYRGRGSGLLFEAHGNLGVTECGDDNEAADGGATVR